MSSMFAVLKLEGVSGMSLWRYTKLFLFGRTSSIWNPFEILSLLVQELFLVDFFLPHRVKCREVYMMQFLLQFILMFIGGRDRLVIVAWGIGLYF